MDDEHIICQACQQGHATVHLTEFVDGQPVQKHFCEECYEQLKDVPSLIPGKVLGQMIHVIEAVAPQLKELSQKVCPECGISYLEFRHTMKLGCPFDYEVFGDALENLLGQVHGATEHIGKVPARASGEATAANRVRALERRMHEAVAKEDYETAARLRDKMREIKADELGSSQE